jgi:hypothetical protein
MAEPCATSQRPARLMPVTWAGCYGRAGRGSKHGGRWYPSEAAVRRYQGDLWAEKARYAPHQ